MKKKIFNKIVEIYAGIYFLFSWGASSLTLVKIFNITNKYVTYIIMLLCMAGNFAILYITLKDGERFNKEKKI